MRFLRLKQVCSKCGISHMTVYRHEKAGTFPRKVRLGVNSIAYLEEEIEQWMQERVAARDQPLNEQDKEHAR